MPPTSTHTAPPVSATPTEAGSRGSASTPGAFTAATDLETYDLGDEYNHEGKYEGKLFKANSANPKSNISLYPSASHATADNPISCSTSAGDPDLTTLSPPTSCCHSTSINLKGVKMIQLAKLVLSCPSCQPSSALGRVLAQSYSDACGCRYGCYGSYDP